MTLANIIRNVGFLVVIRRHRVASFGRQLPDAVIAPLYGGYHYVTATKESIGKKMKCEDLASAEKIMRGDIAPELDQAIMTLCEA